MTSRSPDFRPHASGGIPPCSLACANHAEVREWVAILAQRERLGLTSDEARIRAWRVLTERNPLPASLGRICPHPCEEGCARGDLDDAVQIHALERFLGDWALARGAPLPLRAPGPRLGSVGIVGAGPAGLSAAYQLARRGHAVTIYDRHGEPGGMLGRAIPEYRLPSDIMAREARRILALGVSFRGGTRVGRDVSLSALALQHDALFFALGTQRGQSLPLDLPPTRQASVWTGLDYLRAVKSGAAPVPGPRVLVVGGGNTAVDAARTARRTGAQVTVVYRRTRAEMPALAGEVNAMMAEGVQLQSLLVPKALEAGADGGLRIILQRMRLEGLDARGRPRPVPISGQELVVEADTVLAAVAQTVDWQGVEPLRSGHDRGSLRSPAELGVPAWVGGDMVAPATAAQAVAHGRRAALSIHGFLNHVPDGWEGAGALDGGPERRAHVERHERRPPQVELSVSAQMALANPTMEVHATLSVAAFEAEVRRCLSCGLCRGCDGCWMFCTAGGFEPLAHPAPGRYYRLRLEACEGCGKCVDLCPTGYLGFADDGVVAGTGSDSPAAMASIR